MFDFIGTQVAEGDREIEEQLRALQTHDGDDENRPQKAISAAVKAMVVDTLGGRIQVSWDKESSATPFGQLVYFAEFLQVSGLFEDWVEECPLIYNSPSPEKA